MNSNRQREDAGGLSVSAPHHLLPLSSEPLLWCMRAKSKPHCGMRILDGSRLGQLIPLVRGVGGNEMGVWVPLVGGTETQSRVPVCGERQVAALGVRCLRQLTRSIFFAARNLVVVAFCWRLIVNCPGGVQHRDQQRQGPFCVWRSHC